MDIFKLLIVFRKIFTIHIYKTIIYEESRLYFIFKIVNIIFYVLFSCSSHFLLGIRIRSDERKQNQDCSYDRVVFFGGGES